VGRSLYSLEALVYGGGEVGRRSSGGRGWEEGEGRGGRGTPPLARFLVWVGQPCGGGGHTRTDGWAPSLNIGQPQISLTNPRHFIAKVDPIPLSPSLYLLVDDVGERNQARISTTTTTRSLIWTVTNESNNKLTFILCALLEEKIEIEEMKQLTATMLLCGTVVAASASADSKVDVGRLLGSWPCLTKFRGRDEREGGDARWTGGSRQVWARQGILGPRGRRGDGSGALALGSGRDSA
jgi:hypothetical protein